MKRDLLPLVTLDGLQAAYRIALPCDCGRPRCNLGDHLWQSTRDMGPGPRATNTDPRSRSWPTDNDDPDPPDATDGLHTQYTQLLAVYQNAARNLSRFVDSYRPDRWVPLPEPVTDEDWCRNHLAAGICEPRDRGDLCRWCYDIGRAHGTAPDPILIRARHQGQRITDTLIDDFLARIKTARRTKRARAS
jgi:hypothetical protein